MGKPVPMSSVLKQYEVHYPPLSPTQNSRLTQVLVRHASPDHVINVFEDMKEGQFDRSNMNATMAIDFKSVLNCK